MGSWGMFSPKHDLMVIRIYKCIEIYHVTTHYNFMKIKPYLHVLPLPKHNFVWDLSKAKVFTKWTLWAYFTLKYGLMVM